MEKLLTIDEVAEILRVKKSTIYGLVHSRRIPHRKITRKILRFSETDIRDWLDRKAPPMLTCGHNRTERSTFSGARRVTDSRIKAIVETAIKEVSDTWGKRP